MAGTTISIALVGGLLAMFLVALAPGLAGAHHVPRETGTVVSLDPLEPTEGTLERATGEILSFSGATFLPAVGECVTFDLPVEGHGESGEATNLEPCSFDDDSDKVTICHKGINTIAISPNAVATHITKHGDTLGSCP